MSDSATTSAFLAIQEQLQNPTLNDQQVFDLLQAQAKYASFDDGRYTRYDPTRCAAIGEAMKQNREANIANALTVTITTCKRLDLFQPTMNSFLACCTDLSRYVTEWIVVDDNSPEDQRKKMQELYPFVTYIWKTPEQKGHARSMNILLPLLKTPWVFHLEDDWRFFLPGEYITKSLEVIQQESPTNRLQFGQCLLNRSYGEDLEVGARIGGGHMRYTPSGLRYYIHEYATGAALEAIHKKLATQGMTHCVYWPHYSLRVGLTRKAVFDTLGPYSETADHFEREYAYRYREKFLTTFLDSVVCTHIGRRTYERGGEKLNAYDLNAEKQFGVAPKTAGNSGEIKLDAISQQVRDEASTAPAPSRRPFDQIPRVVMKCSVINLERRPDRLQKFQVMNAGEMLNFHVFNAVDGQALKPCHKIQRLFQHNDYNYRRGIVGCALSHVTLWLELMFNPNLNAMLILEDDAELTKDFMMKFMHLLAEYPEADIIFLGHHPYPQYRRANDYNRERFPTAERWSKERSKRESMGGTTGYYITKQGAFNLLDWIDKNSIRNGIDWTMWESEKNKVYYCSPFLVFADCFQSGKAVDTDIQNVYDGVGYADERTWLAEELKYWGETGVRKRFADLPCYEDEKSRIVCSEEVRKEIILGGITIFRNSPETRLTLDEYPVHWYSINNYILSVPDNLLVESNLKARTFRGYLNRKVLLDSVGS